MINTTEGKIHTASGKRASIWDGSPQATMATAEAATIHFREGIPWVMWAFRLSWKGPFRPWSRIHWRILWGLDIFAGPVPIVKTMIAANILAWIILWFVR